MGSPPSCPAGFRWREWGSCVRVDDCTCRSSSGAVVKVYHRLTFLMKNNFLESGPLQVAQKVLLTSGA